MDIENKEDIIHFVNAFYAKVREDQFLGPIFIARLGKQEWKVHLERMYSFWNTVLFGVCDYRGNPFVKHQNLPIDKEHFDRWLSLLYHTIDSNYQGLKADEVKLRAEKMAIMFQVKLNHLRSNENFKSIM